MERVVTLLLLLLLQYPSIGCRPSMNTILVIQYYFEPTQQIDSLRIPVTLLVKNRSDRLYFLTGQPVDEKTLSVSSISCVHVDNDTHQSCSEQFQTSKIVLDHVMDNQSVLVLDTEDKRLKQILHSLIDQTSNETLMRNITCTLDEIWNSKRMSHYNFTRTNVLAVIFLSTCTSLTVVLCMGWLAVLYYRRYKQGRIDRKLQMALAHAVRQVLDQTPMVTFEAKKNEQESSDDHPLCAICLETFINDEQIRKLPCLHHFHAACVDPWLLEHQNCPLCNQSVLQNPLPSISAQVTVSPSQSRTLASTTMPEVA